MSRSRGRRFPVRALAFLAAGLLVWAAESFRERRGPAGDPAAGAVVEAYREHRSGIVVEVSGTVERLLSDDLEGSRHQRFILQLEGGHTVLVSHNIDLSRRVPLSVGDGVEVRGQYEWNERGGVLHWTHHDPQGHRPGGWIRHRGVTIR
ncbi:MAG: DUF3465 domain-containing protein [Acidobacteria bacterium]|nr:DUF3465 domain-containing protein [Acidobacteriota bacterium]